MTFDPELAEIRFGTGLSPLIAAPTSVEEMLARLRGPDLAATAYPIETYEEFAKRVAKVSELWRVRRQNNNKPLGEQTRKLIGKEKQAAKRAKEAWLWQAICRRAHTQDGLRERLAFFWADHFTARGKVSVMKRATSPYVESAIRPHVAGRFADMLKAVVMSPVMLQYLDQKKSIGPESRFVEAKRLRRMMKGKKPSPNQLGLNENLARELLELHTLGVGGGYDQTDVFELAELLTGLTYDSDGVFGFRSDYAQPGGEVVLGKTYGSRRRARLSNIHAALDDLAMHPDTARHLAEKMAVHFLGDQPDAGAIAQMEQAYLASAGDLGEMTRAMLEHSAAWLPERRNVKQPIDFVGSACRALAVPADTLAGDKWPRIQKLVSLPLRLMGQTWEEPLGPDGWPEEDAEWITPQRFAARFDWAMSAPAGLLGRVPDPREFATVALGRDLPEAVRFAAEAAEDRRTGVGLILASPSFQRM